jgi:hypothetical protein
MIEAQFVFELLVLLLDRPALMRGLHQVRERGRGRQVDQIVLGARIRLGPSRSLPMPGVCYSALRRLPRRDLHPLATNSVKHTMRCLLLHDAPRRESITRRHNRLLGLCRAELWNTTGQVQEGMSSELSNRREHRPLQWRAGSTVTRSEGERPRFPFLSKPLSRIRCVVAAAFGTALRQTVVF